MSEVRILLMIVHYVNLICLDIKSVTTHIEMKYVHGKKLIVMLLVVTF